MAADPIERSSILRDAKHYGRLKSEVGVDRVRCVLRHRHRYLPVQPNSRRLRNRGKWALPGGRLKRRERPKAGLRRELTEELRLEVPYLLRLGDWRDRNENHRVFGSQIEQPVDWFNTDEIIATGWFTSAEVTALALASRLHRGFEVAAIREFRIRQVG